MKITILIIILTLLLLFLFIRWFTRRTRVYCIKKNVYRYTAAVDICGSLGGRIATRDEVQRACYYWGGWNTLGWCKDFFAYNCGRGGIDGGKSPGQLKLGVYYYGPRPDQETLDHYGVTLY